MSRKATREVKGKVYGQWTVISNELKRHTDRSIYYNVRCQCGREGWRAANLLETGRTKACKSCCKTPQNTNTFINSYLNKVRRRAEISGFKFNLTTEYVEQLFNSQNNICALSGIPIEFKPSYKRNTQTASLDRIDNTKGYIEGNVQWVHKDVNFMKHQFDQQHFLDLCRRITNHSFKRVM